MTMQEHFNTGHAEARNEGALPGPVSLVGIEHEGGVSHVVEVRGRHVVLAHVPHKFGGVAVVPFYRHSGGNAKAGVEAGQWLPYMGHSGGKNNWWFNKTPGVNDYYGSNALRETAHKLDDATQTITAAAEGGIPKAGESTRQFINNTVREHFNSEPAGPIDPRTPEHIDRVLRTIHGPQFASVNRYMD